GVGIPLLDGINDPVRPDAVIEHAGAAAHHQLARRLIGKSQAGSETAQRYALAQCTAAIVDENAVRRSRIKFGVIVRHNPLAHSRPGRGRSGWRDRHGLNAADPSLSEVSILIGQRSVKFPANAEIQRQPRAVLEIVLKVSTGTTRAVAMDDSSVIAAGAEQAGLNIARCGGLRVAGTANQQVVECSDG